MESISQIKVNKEDDELMMNDCKELYLKHHPELDELKDKISRAYMFNKLVEFFLGR